MGPPSVLLATAMKKNMSMVNSNNFDAILGEQRISFSVNPNNPDVFDVEVYQGKTIIGSGKTASCVEAIKDLDNHRLEHAKKAVQAAYSGAKVVLTDAPELIRLAKEAKIEFNDAGREISARRRESEEDFEPVK